MFWVEHGIPIPPVNRIIQRNRTRGVLHKFSVMDYGDSIVLPYTRSSVKQILKKSGQPIRLVSRQLNEYQFRYWKMQ